MASASEAELLIVVDNLMKFMRKNASLLELVAQCFEVQIGLQKLKEHIEARRGKLVTLVISSIREFVREVEEAIEACVVLGLIIERKTRTQSHVSRHKDLLIKRIDTIWMKFFQIFQDLESGSMLFSISSKNDQRWNDKALFIVDDYKHTVGRRDEVEKVLSLVIKICNVGDGNLEVIWITGMVGLGKTKLAGRVFKCGMLSFMFSLRAFISVPGDYSNNKKMVFIEILRQFGTEEKISRMEETELVKMLGDFLNSSNFLIVLDDVDGMEVVDDIRSSMDSAGQQQGNKQSKGVLLITTRRRKSAMDMEYSKNHYNFDLRLLETEESKALLRMETFGKNECPKELEECETKIVEKSYGMPLAIVSFARILMKHREKIQWWKKVADYVNVFTEESLINKAIRSIFDKLDANLKLCFLYLGVFERDAHIPVSVLLRLWMAEGLVGEVERSHTWTEDVAENYLEELVERSLVMVSQRRSNGKIKAIKIHDGVLEFCISEAKEGNVFKESFFSETSRRFCIRDSVTVSKQFYIWNPVTKPYPLQSILYIADGQLNLSKGTLFSLFPSSIVSKTFNLLRVLDVRSFELTKLPAQLFSLVLLRYMAISCNTSFLPKQLSNLCYLETLIVWTSSESETLEIRADIRDMALLGHINSKRPILIKEKSTNCESNNKPANQNLRAISKISHMSCTKEFFQGTPNLKKLAISLYFREPSSSNKQKQVIFGRLFRGNGSRKQEEEELLQQLEQVEQLQLKLQQVDQQVAQEQLVQLPQLHQKQQQLHQQHQQLQRQLQQLHRQLQQRYLSFFGHLAELNSLENLKVLNRGFRLKYPLPLESHSFPKSLTKLTLVNTYLDQKNMLIIGEMLNLETLKLQFCEFEGDLWGTEEGGFLKLKSLHIRNTGLTQWEASWNHFPMLTSLSLFRCDHLQILPVGLPDMQTLQTVIVYYGHSTLAPSLKAVLSNKLETQLGFHLTIYPN